MATSKKLEKQRLKQAYGTKNIERARKTAELQQAEEARQRAESLKKSQRLLGPGGQVAKAGKIAALEPEQRGSTVNVLGRGGQDPAAMQAAARAAAAGGQQVSQQAATGAGDRARQLVGSAAALRGEAQKQAIEGLGKAADPWGAEMGKKLVEQGASNLVETATGVPQELSEEGTGAVRQAGILSAPFAMGS